MRSVDCTVMWVLFFVLLWCIQLEVNNTDMSLLICWWLIVLGQGLLLWGLNPKLGEFNRECQRSVHLFGKENTPLFFLEMCRKLSEWWAFPPWCPTVPTIFQCLGFNKNICWYFSLWHVFLFWRMECPIRCSLIHPLAITDYPFEGRGGLGVPERPR